MDTELATTIFFSIGAYFLPWLISCMRGHHQWLAIGALNFFLGWTGLGWIACFVWALTAVRQDTVTITTHAPQPSTPPKPETLQNWPEEPEKTPDEKRPFKANPYDRV